MKIGTFVTILGLFLVLMSCGCVEEEKSSSNATETKAMQVSTVSTNAETTSSYSVDFDLRNMVGFNDNAITANDIEEFIHEKYPSSPMLNEANIGTCFIVAGQSNNVNPAFLVATACLEGGFGTLGWAASHPECHNTFGYGIPNGSTSPDDFNCMDSWCAMVQKVASVIAHGTNYYSQGRYTISQVRAKYAADPNADSIASLMNELYTFSINHKLASLSTSIAADQTPTTNVQAHPVSEEKIVAGTLLQQLNCGQYRGVWSVAFSPDGNKLAASSYEGPLLIWDIASGTELQTLETYDFYGFRLAFSPDGSKLAAVTIGSMGRILIYDVNSGEKLQWIDHWAILPAFRPSGTELVTSDGDNTIYIWDVIRGTNLETLYTETNRTMAQAISLDGSKLAACNYDERTVSIWDTTNGVKLQEIELNHPADFAAFSIDGSKLALHSMLRDEISIWDVKSGTKLREFNLKDNSGSQLSPLAFSPDGSKLAAVTVGSFDKILIYDVNSGEKLLDLKLNSTLKQLLNGPYAIAFSLDSSKLAIGQNDGYVPIWAV